VMSVDPNWHQAWDWPCVSGRELSPDDETRMNLVCVLGQSVRKELFGDGDPVGGRVRLGRFSCMVVGVLEARGITGMAHDLDRRVLVPMSTGMKRLFRLRHLSTLRLKMKPGYSLDQAATSAIQLLNQRHQVDPKLQTPFSAVTSASLVKRFQGFSDTVQRLLLGLSALALLVGGGVLMNLLLASVSQRKGEIGLRRALGASARDIFQQFLCEAVTVSLAGLAAGWVLGLLATFAAASLFDMPAAVPPWGMALGGGLSLAVGLAAGVLPARRAAAMPPVDALR
jgi:putative ABC transport system permease protein